jgi:hypothetical protein
LRNHTIEWQAIGNDLWQQKDGQQKMFGIRDPSGRITRIALDFSPSSSILGPPRKQH